MHPRKNNIVTKSSHIQDASLYSTYYKKYAAQVEKELEEIIVRPSEIKNRQWRARAVDQLFAQFHKNPKDAVLVVLGEGLVTVDLANEIAPRTYECLVCEQRCNNSSCPSTNDCHSEIRVIIHVDHATKCFWVLHAYEGLENASWHHERARIAYTKSLGIRLVTSN